jgi:DNA-binding response OmpR family regulator
MQIKILFVEDEETIAMAVSEALKTRGYDVMHERYGEAALKTIGKSLPDLCILDVMLPKMDGFAIAQEIKKIDATIPILFLTARTGLEDVLHGFETGGDDYLKKPFSLAELMARVNALLKRKDAEKTTEEVTVFNGYIFIRKRQLIQNPAGEKYVLSYRETELFNLLIENKNGILYRKQALLKIWGDDNFFNARTMDVFISRLRKYFKDDSSIQIMNVRGVGYKLIIND